MAVLKLCLGFYLLLFSLFPVSDGAVTSPQDQEACVGENVTIPWEYDDADADVVSVFWRVNTSTDVMTYFGTTRDPVNGYNVVASNDKGSITITSATRSNSGTYRIDVTATQASSDQVEVLICDAAEASGLKGTKSGSEWKCEASNLGDPEAELYIKVNGKRKSSSSANVARSDKVECCLYGCAVKCMETADDYEYCEVVKTPDVSFPVWAIVLIVVFLLFVTGIITGYVKYFCEKCKKDGLEWWVIALCVIIVGFGIITVWAIRKGCCSQGDVEPRVRSPRNETQSGNPHTIQKKSETKKNKSKDSVAHTANEQHNQGRKQPPPPSDAGAAAGTTLNGREDSDGAVSREHVDLQESGRTLKQRPMPDIPRKTERQGHDSKGRGLSANFNDDDHPLIGVNIPIQKAGALEALPEGTGGDGSVKKLKKKKKKSKDQEDEV